MEQRYIIARHLNAGVCQKSSSGGAFTAITDAWFRLHGDRAVVYGCAFDENLKARHMRATNHLQRDKMRGSKYIGSDMSGVMRQVVEDLENGNCVAFSGTPCQVAGLKSVVAAKKIAPQERLLTIEVVCHGVGSVKFFEDYLKGKEKRYRSKAVYCSFRGKRRPDKRTQMVVGFESGKEFVSASTKCDEYLSAYSRNYAIREACFNCKYATVERTADIVISDAWSAEKDKYDVRSMMMVNSITGMQVFDMCKADLYCEAVQLKDVMQPQLIAPAKRPADYEDFWKVYRGAGYHQAQKYLGNTTLKGKVRAMIAEIVYRLYIVEGVRAVRGILKRNKGKKE